MASSGARRLELAVPVLALGAVLLAALILIPMGWLGYVSLGGLQGGLTFGNFAALVRNPDMLWPLLLSLGVAFAVAVVCALVASPLAWLVARTDLPWKRAFRLAANGLERIPAELEEASSILGAPRWRTAARVTLPLALPALLAGTLVAFLQAMNNFGAPAILALPAGLQTITTKI